jgi:2-dehydro-3-deoxy-L-rhamnonate dehydrogenase (NAD+)
MASETETALITGGAHGIGLACAKALSAAGSNIILLDTDAEALVQAKESFTGRPTHTVVADITDYAAIEDAIKRVEKDLYPITQMVNSAGIAGPNTTVEEYPTRDWHQIMDINLTGSFHMLKAVLPGMKSRGYGRIVMVASIAGKDGNPNASAYSASKAGVIALTKSAGKECAKMNIGINCITPAAAKTRIFDQMSQEHIDYMLSKIPRERFLQVEEVADMVNWLCSSGNSFTTGAVFDLSGGRATY